MKHIATSTHPSSNGPTMSNHPQDAGRSHQEICDIYGTSPLLMGKLTVSMAMFNSYVKLPEGIHVFN